MTHLENSFKEESEIHFKELRLELQKSQEQFLLDLRCGPFIRSISNSRAESRINRQRSKFSPSGHFETLCCEILPSLLTYCPLESPRTRSIIKNLIKPHRVQHFYYTTMQKLILWFQLSFSYIAILNQYWTLNYRYKSFFFRMLQF